MVKNPLANAGDIRDMGSIFRSGRSPGGGDGCPFQCSCLENSHRQRSLADYSPWGQKELDKREQLTHTHTHTRTRTRTHRHTDDFTGRLYQISEEEIKSISHDLFQQTGGNTFQNVLSLVLP